MAKKAAAKAVAPAAAKARADGSPRVEMVETKFSEPKEVKDIRIAVRDLFDSIREAGKDGFQAAQDIPSVVFANLKSLSAALEGFDKVDDAYKQELGACLKSNGLLVGEITEALTKKK